MRDGHITVHTWTVVVLMLCLPQYAFADPPGFKKIQITDTPDLVEFRPKINDLGDIVWCSRPPSGDNPEIWLYSEGATTQLTDDDIQDVIPDINNDRVIVWSRGTGRVGDDGWPILRIARWQDGAVDYLTDGQDDDDEAPVINNRGDIAWNHWTEGDCGNSVIELYHDGVIRELGDGSDSNQATAINDSGYTVWTRYPCKHPHAIMMSDLDGNTTKLNKRGQPQAPSISPTGVVVWTDSDVLYKWDRGTVTKVTDHASILPVINSHGDIVFGRSNEDVDRWESWLYIGGDIRQIAAGGDNEYSYDMNERGDIVTLSADYEIDQFEIFLYQRLPTGDMNCDEKVDFDDIDGFVDAITDRTSYESRNPSCDWWLADCNGDRKIDMNDIAPFVECLINNGCP